MRSFRSDCWSWVVFSMAMGARLGARLGIIGSLSRAPRIGILTRHSVFWSDGGSTNLQAERDRTVVHQMDLHMGAETPSFHSRMGAAREFDQSVEPAFGFG